MNQISQHITYLLLSCRKVAVPGLGIFSVTYTRAAFDSEYGVFYPSRISIDYDYRLKVDSKPLIDSVSRKLKINRSEAELLISDFVDQVSNRLRKNNYCKLDGIGYLINNNGKLSLKGTCWKRSKHTLLSPMSV